MHAACSLIRRNLFFIEHIRRRWTGYSGIAEDSLPRECIMWWLWCLAKLFVGTRLIGSLFHWREDDKLFWFIAHSTRNRAFDAKRNLFECRTWRVCHVRRMKSLQINGIQIILHAKYSANYCKWNSEIAWFSVAMPLLSCIRNIVRVWACRKTNPIGTSSVHSLVINSNVVERKLANVKFAEKIGCNAYTDYRAAPHTHSADETHKNLTVDFWCGCTIVHFFAHFLFVCSFVSPSAHSAL